MDAATGISGGIAVAGTGSAIYGGAKLRGVVRDIGPLQTTGELKNLANYLVESKNANIVEKGLRATGLIDRMANVVLSGSADGVRMLAHGPRTAVGAGFLGAGLMAATVGVGSLGVIGLASTVAD